MAMNPKYFRPRTNLQQGTPASLLMNFDSAIVDESPSPLTVTQHGTPTISTSVKMFGSGGSLSLNGSNAYLSVPLTGFGDDWTIEAWVYFTDMAGEQAIVELFNGSVGFVLVKIDSSNAVDGDKPFFYANGTAIYNGSNVRMSANQWYHVAAVSSYGIVSLYLDGALQDSSVANTATVPSQELTIGARDGGSNFFKGYIDGLRITKAALYCDSFTVPSAPPSPTVTPPTCPMPE